MSIPHGYVRAVNYGAVPFTGWQRTTISHPEGGTQDCARYGRELGDGQTRAVDVFVSKLLPGEERDILVARDDPTPHPAPEFSADEVAEYLGGLPRIDGVEMTLGSIALEGAAFVSCWHAFILDSVWVDLWLRTYPGQPWGKGTLSFNRCNPKRPDYVTYVDHAIRLELDGALVHVLGRGYGAPLVRRGEQLADASRRSFPVTVSWPRLFVQEQAESATVDAEAQVHLFGLQPEAMGPLGAISPTPATAGYALQHMRENLPEAIEDLHTDAIELMDGTAYTAHSALGPTAYSGQTGAQEDQPGWTQMSEAFWPGGVGVGFLRLLVALNQGQQTIHYREADGTPLSLTRHPGLVMWDGRPHWSKHFSPDQLGKSGNPPWGWDNGWRGPDREHWFIATLGAAYLATGDQCVQSQLDAHARVFLYSITLDPRLSTTMPGAARAVGWTSLVAAWLWLTLEDRDLAAQVWARWVSWMDQVVMPALDHKDRAVEHWDHIDDDRVWHDLGGKKTYTGAWMPYQQAVGAAGVYIAACLFGHEAARDFARRAALAVVNYGYTFDGDTPVEWDFVAYHVPGVALPPRDYAEKVGAHRTGWFQDAWTPMAAWVVLKEDPADARARAIYSPALERARLSTAPAEWLPPL